MRKYSLFLILLIFLLFNIPLSQASYLPFNTDVGMNVGIGTSTPQGGLIVMNGGVGIGTWAPINGLGVNSNAAIGETFVGKEYAPSNGLIVQGNTGIGTWGPSTKLQVFDSFDGTAKTVFVIGSTGSSAGTDIGMQFQEQGYPAQAAAGIRAVDDGNNMSLRFDTYSLNALNQNKLVIRGSGNIGISSISPGQLLDVQGTARMIGFTLTGNGAGNGNVIVGNGVGVGTWMNLNTLPLATVNPSTTNNVTYYSNTNTFSGSAGFQTNGTNVGIGTSNLANASLQVVGNIGIGTVKNGDLFINTAPPNGGMIIEGNVGIGTPVTASRLQIGPGTSSVPPISLAAGSIGASGTGSPGAIEFDGTAFYATAADSSRQVVVAQQFISLTSSYTLVSQTAAQPLFNSTTNGALTVQGSTSYFFDCFFTLTGMSATNGTFGFQLGGTATQSASFESMAAKVAAFTNSSTLQVEFTTTGVDTSLTSNSTNTNGIAHIRGIIRVTAGGTIIPEVNLSRAAAAVVGTDSYFTLHPLGSDTATSQGDWS